MRRLTFLFCSILLAAYSLAQTQQGYVKTRGRMVNGTLVAGQRLPGATVQLNFGNAIVSGSNGAFSFVVPANKIYSLVSATKQGYTLADPEFTSRSFAYSAQNPFYVVLEDNSQRQADINAATRKVRRTLQHQLQAKEDEIEALKEQQQITEQEYQQRLQQLYDSQSQLEQMVKQMAERYVSTDYDQLDEFNRLVQHYIEEGDLQKADSMIRSKGDMAQRVEEYQQAVAANKKVREDLERSEAAAAKTYEDLSQDLYRRHEIFLQEFKKDSALYCMKTRADLDTTNLDAVWQYAFLASEQKKLYDAEKYYLICLRGYVKNNDMVKAATIQNNLGVVYGRLHDYSNSEKYYRQALWRREQLTRDMPHVYRADLASTQNNLGVLYEDLHDYSNSEKYLLQALKNYEQFYYWDNPYLNKARMARTLNNLGYLYLTLHDYSNSEKYFKRALWIREELFRENPNAYRADLAYTQCGLGSLYLKIQDYSNSEKYFKQALENYEQLASQNPEINRGVIFAKILNDLSYVYAYMTNISKAIETIDEAMARKPDYANLYDTKGEILLMQGKEQEALQMWKKVLELKPDFLNDYPNSELYKQLKERGLIE